jgi:hypothetical protein
LSLRNPARLHARQNELKLKKVERFVLADAPFIILRSIARTSAESRQGEIMPGARENPRTTMFNGNKLKLGIFSPNCSGGMAVTKVPERWDASWENNLKLAQMADEAGIEFLLA